MTIYEEAVLRRVCEITERGSIARFHDPDEESWKDVKAPFVRDGAMIQAFRVSENANAYAVWLGYDDYKIQEIKPNDDGFE